MDESDIIVSSLIKLWHVFLVGFEPAILRAGKRLVSMALSAKSISLMVGYDVVFEGQEKLWRLLRYRRNFDFISGYFYIRWAGYNLD